MIKWTVFDDFFIFSFIRKRLASNREMDKNVIWCVKKV